MFPVSPCQTSLLPPPPSDVSYLFGPLASASPCRYLSPAMHSPQLSLLTPSLPLPLCLSPPNPPSLPPARLPPHLFIVLQLLCLDMLQTLTPPGQRMTSCLWHSRMHIFFPPNVFQFHLFADLDLTIFFYVFLCCFFWDTCQRTKNSPICDFVT